MSESTGPEVVYGGPYAEESDVLTLESSKESPNYDAAISGWKTISQGALNYIEQLKNPPARPVGKFINNVEVDYGQVDGTIPAIAEVHETASTFDAIFGEGE